VTRACSQLVQASSLRCRPNRHKAHPGLPPFQPASQALTLAASIRDRASQDTPWPLRLFFLLNKYRLIFINSCN
jgi:hypothetical protein